MISFEKVCKSYGETAVLQDFSLRIPLGKTTALMGPSGCGKTTLMRLLGGLAKPDSGSITGLEGRKISYVFQEDRLLYGLSAKKNLEFVAPAGDWLQRVELGGQEEQNVEELSGGMRRRVSLARALAYGGEIFLLDEPFTGMDEALRERMAALLKETLQGKTVLLITHDLRDAQALGGEVIPLAGPPLRIESSKG